MPESAPGTTSRWAPSCSPPSSGSPAAATARHGSTEPLAIEVDRLRARFGAWYELFPRSWGGLERRRAPAAAARRARLRRRLPAADPPDRADQPQGRQQLADRRTRRSGLALGDRRRRPAATTRSTPSSARSRTSQALTEAAQRARHRDRARLRDPVLGRPPVADRAPRVVPPPPRRDAEVRREPAQALPGHLQRQLGLAGLARRCGRRCSRSSCTGSTAASRCSGSTTRTPSRSRSGSG